MNTKKYTSKSLKLSFNPESLRLVFYIFFWLFSIFAIIITLIAHPKILSHNHILTYYNVNNICVFFDDPPAIYFLPCLWAIALIPLVGYYFLIGIAAFSLYRQGIISLFITYKRYATAFIGIIAACFFSTVFAVHPEQNIILHTVPFIFLIIQFWILSTSNMLFYSQFIKVNQGVRIYFISYHFVLSITSILYISLMLNAFLGYPWYNIHSVSYNFYAPFIDKFWTFLGAILPLIHCSYLRNRTSPINLNISV